MVASQHAIFTPASQGVFLQNMVLEQKFTMARGCFKGGCKPTHHPHWG